ncbi:D-alanyl-D-alanine carboxypeptidase family protein [Desulfofalx alkaliphila]|uniref:D-alanyl-D-alanine carboxypeptidase family protein n=1 Tax=Desulfofalx alkaliphila TaxID=105483 RepID=UPI000A873A97|nr:D-alanyl-D-alanine carboxypeptidase family protein [Desulfofalx alkaliphila]
MHIRSSLMIALMVIVIKICWLSCAEAGISQFKAPEITADAAVLIDANTGQVLFDKNMHQRRPPASTTKIMTALLALEGGNLTDKVTVSDKAAQTGECSINLRPNEILTLEALIYGALMRSGNDACVAIAEHVAGSEENFIRLMNHHAKILGAQNTNFLNTNGLPEDQHYSTAYDLAQIARYAMNKVKFRDIVSTKSKEITNEDGEKRFFQNTNKLLWLYRGSDGIKTGTTDAAGSCLVGSAKKDGRHLISVVLHSDDRYADTIKLLNHGFDDYEEVVVLTKGEHFTTLHIENGYSSTVPIIAGSGLSVLVPKGEIGTFEQLVKLERNLSAPIRYHQRVGTLDVSVKGEVVGSVELITGAAINKLPVHLKIYNKLDKHL